MGKGGKERIVPFGHNTRSWLRTYMKRRNDLSDVEFENPDLLFVTEYGGSMTVFHMNHRLKLYGTKAGITGVRVSNHTFRHFAAITWLRNGGDLFALQRLLGHSSLDMVRRYANYNDSDITKQHEKYSPVDRMVQSGAITVKPSKVEMKRGRKKIK
jgi:integrase/recombinase XerD